MDNLICAAKDDGDFSNNLSVAFAVDFVAYYLHDKYLLPLKNSFWMSLFILVSLSSESGLFFHSIS